MLAHLSGSREEALAELERRARSFSPEHPRHPRRRRLLRQSDGFLLVVESAMELLVTRFTVAELLEDSAAPPAPRPAEGRRESEPVAAPAQPPPAEMDDVERYSDGVPVTPVWLGRDGLW